MANIFVSYTGSDRHWAQWIGGELSALGHRPRIHEQEVRGGDSFIGWMNQRLRDADHTLCIISPAYLVAAPFSQGEFEAAISRAQTTPTHNFLLPVVVEGCELPPLLHYRSHCDLVGLGDAEKQARFRDFIARSVAASRPPTAQAAGAASNIPIAVPRHFMGRDDAFAAIEAALHTREGRVAITALHGLRGVGKTVLAAAYAERHAGDYRATWWIRAETDSGMRADLAGLGVRLGWVHADDKEDLALTIVRERLRHEGGGLLLIYDNAVGPEAVEPRLPGGGTAHVIVTSNAPHWRRIAAPVEIAVWPPETGADYLIARTGRTGERAAALELSAALGGLPLAHEQAAAYCERLDIALAEYRRRFEARPVEMLGRAQDAPADYHPEYQAEHRDRLTVARTFGLAIDEAAKLRPAAEQLIVHAALLAPAAIPLFLFAEAREKFAEPLAGALADDGLDEVVAALRTFALVDRETIPDERDPAIATDAIRLHRLVREVAAARCDGEARETARHRLIEALAVVYPSRVDEHPGSWPRARRVDALALALVGGDMALPAGAEQAAGALLDGLASYRREVLAAYAEATPLCKRALALREASLGPDHPDTALSLNNLAWLLQAQGDLPAARPLYERALAIRETALGADHPDTARGLNNLGLLLRDQGDLPAARPLLGRALAIHEKVLGAEHPDTATSLSSLAGLLLAQGDLPAARPLYERALAIHEKVLGAEHPDTATSLSNLAELLRDQGDLPAARPLHERALAICEKMLGAEHPDTATSLSNLAGLLQAQGDLPAARPLHERALAIREKMLGPEHPDTATGLNNLGALLRDQGDLPAARPLFERALAIHEKMLGAEHPDTAQSLNNLGALLRDRGDLPAARPLFERALAIRQKVLGAEHPDTAGSLNNLAALVAQGNVPRARALLLRALAIASRKLGRDHPTTALYRKNLADLGGAGPGRPGGRRR